MDVKYGCWMLSALRLFSDRKRNKPENEFIHNFQINNEYNNEYTARIPN